MAVGRLESKTIDKGTGRLLTVSAKRYSKETVNILVDDTIEGVYRGVDVSATELIAALWEIGALDKFLGEMRDATVEAVRDVNALDEFLGKTS